MRLKIGVVGAGTMSMNHLRVLRDLDDEDVQLVGVAETYEPNLKQAVSRFHVAIVDDRRSLLREAQGRNLQPSLIVEPGNRSFCGISRWVTAICG